MKAALPHGAFGRWLDDEVRWTARTAQNYMNAAAAFAEKSETVSHLPVRTLYRLAAPCTSNETRDAALALIDNPSAPPLEKIENILFQSKMAPRRKPKAREPSPAQQRREARYRRKQEKENMAREASRARQTDYAERLVTTLEGAEVRRLIEFIDADPFFAAVSLKGALASRGGRA